MSIPERSIAMSILDLDVLGRLLDSESGQPVEGERVSDYLEECLDIPDDVTDIYVHVHGWQTRPQVASTNARQLLSMAMERLRERPDFYPILFRKGYRPWVISVRWPSSSRPSLGGYRLIRDRAHEMGAQGRGQAAFVLAHLLGYLDNHRDAPGPDLLANRSGQFLHLYGHSFGGRFLCEAVQWAATPQGPELLGWSSGVNSQHPFTVDSVLIFQMAAPRNSLATTFPALLPSHDAETHAPICGPIVLTYSRYDRAAGMWHRRAEGERGIGHSGAGLAPAYVHNIELFPVSHAYTLVDLDHRLVNIDASRVFRRGRLKFAGAHSDINHHESAHLLLSLAELSR